MDWDVRSTQSTSDPEVVNGMSESMQREREEGERNSFTLEFFRIRVCGVQVSGNRDGQTGLIL